MPEITEWWFTLIRLNVTLPCTFHTRYTPPEKFDTGSVSSTLPVASSTTCTVIARCQSSQSSTYSASLYVAWSLIFTSIENDVSLYQHAANRPVPSARCSARGSPVDDAHT